MVRTGSYYFAVANDLYQIGGVGSGATLKAINCGTGAASAVLTLYHGTSTSAPKIGTFACTNPFSWQFADTWYGNGIFAQLTGGNALVTLSAG